MVWCARESADYRPTMHGPMQFFNHYGWIHWDSDTGTWHTVTGYQLAGPGQIPAQSDPPVIQALSLVGEAAAARAAAAEAALAGEAAAASADAAAAHAAVARQSAAAAANAVAGPPHPPAPQAPVQQPAPVAPPAQAPGHGAAPGPAGPPQGAPTADSATVWDTEHKRDEDRADAQHVLDNTRWDTQHTLDNARWDTRHTLENARWDTEHTLQNSRWDTFLALRHSREDTALAVEATLLGAVHGGYIAVAQGSLDRAVQRATYVTTAAGAVATLYTGILGLRYSADHTALPARALIPALFIGAAVAFSTFYMAFLRGSTKRQELLPSGLGGDIAETRLLDFMEWSFGGVLARAWSLRLSVLSLALGLAFLPIGFVQLSGGITWALGMAAVALLVLWIFGEIYVAVAGPPSFIGNVKRQSKLTRTPDPLPDRPADDPSDTGLRPFGLPDPPRPPTVAVGDPPPAPNDARLVDPPEPPPGGRLPVPPAQPGLLEPGPRPATPPSPTASTRIDVVLRTVEDGEPGRQG